MRDVNTNSLHEEQKDQKRHTHTKRKEKERKKDDWQDEVGKREIDKVRKERYCKEREVRLVTLIFHGWPKLLMSLGSVVDCLHPTAWWDTRWKVGTWVTQHDAGTHRHGYSYGVQVVPSLVNEKEWGKQFFSYHISYIHIFTAYHKQCVISIGI